MLWLGLDTNSVWALHIATDDCPYDTTCKHQPCKVTNCGIRLINVAVQKLECWWQLVIKFEHGGDAKQNQETEIHH